MYRILYLYPGPTPPPQRLEWDKHWHLSRVAGGDILLPVWWKDEAEEQRHFPEARRGVGNFRYHVYRYFETPRAFRSFRQFYFYLTNGLRLHRKARYDFIISYGTNVTGIAAALLSVLTGVKLIVEFSGVPDKAYQFEDEKQTPSKLRMLLSNLLLAISVRTADRIRLLFPAQLAGYPQYSSIPSSVFHEFVPVTSLTAIDEDEKYILFIGHPWYLKGVDVLLKAFRRMANDFPAYRLKIVGWCTDRSPFEALASGIAQIEFHPGVPHEQALDLIRRASVFVLPSRTEAMGRVLLEAMALGTPVVASRVDGIPYVVDDQRTGLLFESENDIELEQKLREILTKPERSQSLRAEALKHVHAALNEEQFVTAFQAMLEATRIGAEQGQKRL